MHDIYRREVTLLGDGGSIPLCNVLYETFPNAEIMLLGVEEPRCMIHVPNESVDPTEIENMALVEALFLGGGGVARAWGAREHLRPSPSGRPVERSGLLPHVVERGGRRGG